MSGWDAAEGISRQRPSVLVTGAAGFVGSHVTAKFAGEQWDVTPLDLGDEFPAGPVDIVVSLAATAEPREALNDPGGAYANCTGVMVATLEYARQHGSRVLHVSTNEAHPPRGPYGGAKRCQEIVCETYPDVATTIVVTQSLFGERQQPNKLIPTAIRSILDGDPIRLHRNGKSWASRPFLHVENLASALHHLARSDITGLVHVGAYEEWELIDVVDLLGVTLGVEPLVEAVPAGDRPGHELHADPIGCDVPGWLPEYGTETALENVARWYKWNQVWLR